MGIISHNTKMRNWSMKTLNTDRISNQSRTDHYDWKAHYVAQDICRRAAKMQSNALDIDVRLFYAYSRMVCGRRCTCFKGINQEPKGDCPICFGTGVVGGFEKFGTRTEVIDPSCHCTCVNIIPDIANPQLPPLFVLADDAIEGFFISDVDIGDNIGEVDYYRSYTSNLSMTSTCIIYVKAYGADDSTYFYSHKVKSNGIIVEYNIEDEIARLLSNKVRKLTFKVEMKRNHISSPSPVLSHIYLRYRVKPVNEYTLKCDINPAQNSAMFDMNGGATNSFTSLSVIVDPSKFNSYTTDGFLYEFEKDLKWKIFQIEKKTQVGSETQTTLECTLLQEYETGYQIFPI